MDDFIVSLSEYSTLHFTRGLIIAVPAVMFKTAFSIAATSGSPMYSSKANRCQEHDFRHIMMTEWGGGYETRNCSECIYSRNFWAEGVASRIPSPRPMFSIASITSHMNVATKAANILTLSIVCWFGYGSYKDTSTQRDILLLFNPHIYYIVEALIPSI